MKTKPTEFAATTIEFFSGRRFRDAEPTRRGPRYTRGSVRMLIKFSLVEMDELVGLPGDLRVANYTEIWQAVLDSLPGLDREEMRKIARKL